MRKTILGILTALVATAQTSPQVYQLPDNNFSSSTGEYLAVQLASSANKGVSGQWFSGSVSAASTVCFFWNVTAATNSNATSIGIKQLPGATFPVATAWRLNSAPSGGAAGPCYTVASGSPFSFTLSYLTLPRGTSAIQNIAVSVVPSTGTISGNATIQWSEQ